MKSTGASSVQQPPIGIDLGTTFSVLAYVDSSGRPVTVLNASGESMTPSALLFDEGEIIVGRAATRASVMEPNGYADCFKRHMGGQVYRHKLRGVDVPPVVLSAFVLERLKQDAELQLGPLRQAVITVPAFFDENRRKATQDAGRLAGLEVLDIINEPTAAAVAYGHQHGFLDQQGLKPADAPLRVLVYDLGGGTFDVTILEIHGQQFRTLATDGDVRLGGKDFDERIVDYLAEQFLAEHGVDPRSDPQDAAQLWLDASEAKHALSERSKTSVIVSHAGIRMRVNISREQFEELTQDLIGRTETTTSLVIRAANLEWSQIDRVLLVGGSSRIPIVSEMLRRLTGMTPNRIASPDEVVAHGAALYAAMLMGSDSARGLAGCQLQNVNSHSLGVVGIEPHTGRRTNAILIPKNSPIPCRFASIFHTAHNDQRSVKVTVVEGESHRPEDCTVLGECIVRDLPSGLPKGASVLVEYSYAANGRISISAQVQAARQSAHVQLERQHALELEDLDTWRARFRDIGNHDSTRCEAGAIDERDKTSVLRRLDALYRKIGKAVVAACLPAKLQRTIAAAKSGWAALENARITLEKASLAKQSAESRVDKVRFGSEYARAATAYQHALTQSDFALLVLGREYVSAGCSAPSIAFDVHEALRLKNCLETAT